MKSDLNSRKEGELLRREGNYRTWSIKDKSPSGINESENSEACPQKIDSKHEEKETGIT
jgi:hypothetical protein